MESLKIDKNIYYKSDLKFHKNVQQYSLTTTSHSHILTLNWFIDSDGREFTAMERFLIATSLAICDKDGIRIGFQGVNRYLYIQETYFQSKCTPLTIFLTTCEKQCFRNNLPANKCTKYSGEWFVSFIEKKRFLKANFPILTDVISKTRVGRTAHRNTRVYPVTKRLYLYDSSLSFLVCTNRPNFEFEMRYISVERILIRTLHFIDWNTEYISI